MFYISPGGFMCGADSKAICHQLEAAPADAADGAATTFAWSGTTGTLAGTTGLRIGVGAANTARAVAQNSTAARAITVADSFTNNGKSDWFLPSRDELAEMWLHKTVIGGLADVAYWSSSENDASTAWSQNLGFGTYNANTKATASRVRPVRAF